MKIALLMFGQPRYVQESFPAIQRCLIEPNTPDIFVHMWDDPPKDEPFRVGEGWKNERLTKNPVQTVIDLYKPKNILTENQIEFPNSDVDFTHTLKSGYAGGCEKKEIAKGHVFATHSMWYSINKVFGLIPKHVYDAVILTRFDLGIQHSIKMTEYDLNSIWGEGIGRSELLLNWMNFGNEDNMRMVFQIMTHLFPIFYSTDNVWCNEYWCKKQCNLLGITVKEGNWGLSIPSRNL